MKTDACRRISEAIYRRRRVASALALRVLRTRFHGTSGILSDPRCMFINGRGLVVLMNHFSYRDPLQVGAWLASNPVSGRRLITAPVADHHRSSFVEIFADIFGVQLCPVVTARTVELTGENCSRGAGIRAYLDTAVDTLGAGGIILLAPQGRRMGRLGRPSGRPVANILLHAQRKKIDDFGLICVGMSLPGTKDYERKGVSGFNLFRKVDFYVGHPISASEAERKSGGIDHIDAWIFDRLSELLPVEYR